ncbi:hypothetical protein [Salinisphaera sp. G21_0]|uniref:hypothetical protein n=1 Tax=Salinisphaera sp. G21_0 TaxID=2821094 RepID=UPI001ADAB66A|nr:hypothetical protein [Salinisphaera sp. G21_0]MBO9484372.1 hypothetical protein [Salinisphaera sp. G21_0]
MVVGLVGCDVGKVEGKTAELDDSEVVSVGDEAGELGSCELDSADVGVAERVNCEIVEACDEDCALDSMDDDVRPVDSDIAEADDEGTALSTCELDSAGIGVAEWINSELIEDDEISVLSNRELDRLTDNDVFALCGKFE